MLETVKRLLGIQDSAQDEVLEIIIANVEAHLKVMLDAEIIPEKLLFIVTEISVQRFNRLGSEGMSSESQEGHSVNFYEPEKEFRPYLSIIERERQTVEPGRGKVRFI